MNAMKNAAHLAVLAVWMLLGAMFTANSLFAVALAPVLLYWAWFAGYAAFTTWLVTQLKHPLAALATHAGTFLALTLVPQKMPFGVLRLGLDLLG
jgi:hypothetical protein